MSLVLPHRLEGPPLFGRLHARPNRFLAVTDLDDGRRVEAHLADRGRLENVAYPGAEATLVPASGKGRRTRFSVRALRAREGGLPNSGPWVCVDPVGANRLARALVDAKLLPGLERYRVHRAEVPHGSSRFDFQLSSGSGPPMFLEVKSVGAAKAGTGLFPDAPTLRGARHLRELRQLVEQGQPAGVLFVAQRQDVELIRPHPVDPDFAVALREAGRAGVWLLGVVFEVSPTDLRFLRVCEVVETAITAASRA